MLRRPHYIIHSPLRLQNANLASRNSLKIFLVSAVLCCLILLAGIQGVRALLEGPVLYTYIFEPPVSPS